MKRTFTKLSILVFVFLLVGSAYAQEVTITGTVTTAEDGEPLPGVSVLLQGTNSGTVTDLDGNYSIDVADREGTLVFSY